MKLLHTLILLIISSFLFAQKKLIKPADPFEGLDTVLQKVLKDRKAAGFAVAVISKDKIIYSKGFGFRDHEKQLPVTTNTLFAIGSCTKAFTAFLLRLLNKEGQLDLDKPAR